MKNNERRLSEGSGLFDGNAGGRMTVLERGLFIGACVLASFLFAVIQTSFFYSVRPFGYAPDLCAALAVATGYKFGPKCGGIIGVMSGFFVDAFASVGFSMAIPLYLVLGCLSGILSLSGAFSRLGGIVVFFGEMLITVTVCTLLTVIAECVLRYDMSIIVAISRAVGESACTLIFSPLVYLPTAAVCRALKKRTQGAALRGRKRSVTSTDKKL